MKKLLSIILGLVFALSFCNIGSSAYSGTFKLYEEMPSGEHYGLYKHDNVMYLYEKDGITCKRYTEFTKNQKGTRRHYVTGHICKGWRKIDGKWFYLDYSDGNAAVGTKVIAGKKYIFNKDGSWTGKRSSSTTYPSNFSIKLTIRDMDSSSEFLIDGTSRTLKITAEDDTTAAKKISSAHIQAFYSMISVSEISGIKSPVSGFYVENSYLSTGYVSPAYEDGDEPDDPADTDYLWTDPQRYILEIVCGDESYVVTGDDTAFLFAFTDKTAEKFCHTLWLIKDYRESINL